MKVFVSNIAKKDVKKYRRYTYLYCVRKVSPILVPILKRYQYSDINNPE